GVTLVPRHGQNRTRHEFLREVYRDDPERPDVPALDRSPDAKLAHVQDAHHALFALDDAGTLDPGSWEPVSSFGAPLLPKGCDGHGTAVASVADGTINNQQGVAGVAIDAPLVGMRVGMPWDAPGTDLASDNRLPEAMAAWAEEWQNKARSSVEDKIKRL